MLISGIDQVLLPLTCCSLEMTLSVVVVHHVHGTMSSIIMPNQRSATQHHGNTLHCNTAPRHKHTRHDPGKQHHSTLPTQDQTTPSATALRTAGLTLLSARRAGQCLNDAELAQRSYLQPARSTVPRCHTTLDALDTTLDALDTTRHVTLTTRHDTGRTRHDT